MQLGVVARVAALAVGEVPEADAADPGDRAELPPSIGRGTAPPRKGAAGVDDRPPVARPSRQTGRSRHLGDQVAALAEQDEVNVRVRLSLVLDDLRVDPPAWRSNASRRLVRTLGARRRLIARIVVVRGCRLTSLRWGSLRVFSGHGSEPQRARADLVGAALAAAAHVPATKATSRSDLVR